MFGKPPKYFTNPHAVPTRLPAYFWVEPGWAEDPNQPFRSFAAKEPMRLRLPFAERLRGGNEEDYRELNKDLHAGFIACRTVTALNELGTLLREGGVNFCEQELERFNPRRRKAERVHMLFFQNPENASVAKELLAKRPDFAQSPLFAPVRSFSELAAELADAFAVNDTRRGR